MHLMYLIPAAVLWLLYGAAWLFSAPWWIDYPLFGLACAASALGVFIAGLANVGPRF